MYIIYNSTAHLYVAWDKAKGHWVTTSKRNMAKQFKSQQKARNVIDLVGYILPGTCEIYSTSAVLPADHIQPSTNDETTSEEETDKLTQCLEELTLLCEQRTAETSLQMSLADRKLSDVYHYIEFNTFNAAQGYNACRMLQETLRERRAIKNEASAMQALSHIVNGQLKKVVDEVPQRTYTPRVYKDLFKK